MRRFSKIVFYVSSVCGGIVIAILVLFAAAVTMFFDDPSASYASFIFPVLGLVVAAVVFPVISWRLMGRGHYWWASLAAFPDIIGFFYLMNYIGSLNIK
jgi:hypothetical protein